MKTINVKEFRKIVKDAEPVIAKVLLSTPNCLPCDFLKEQLANHDVPENVHLLELDNATLTKLKEDVQKHYLGGVPALLFLQKGKVFRKVTAPSVNDVLK